MDASERTTGLEETPNDVSTTHSHRVVGSCMEQEFEEFLEQQAHNPAFQAYHYQSDGYEEPDLDQTICAEDQTVVSEVTMLSHSLFQGPLYQNAAAADVPDDHDECDIANLFYKNRNSPQHSREAKRQVPTIALPTPKETEDRSTNPSQDPQSQNSYSSPTLGQSTIQVQIPEANQTFDVAKQKTPAGFAITNPSRVLLTQGTSDIEDKLTALASIQSQRVDIPKDSVAPESIGTGEKKENAINRAIPGAYSAAPGSNMSLVHKTPLPSHLRGDATQQNTQNSARDRAIDVKEFLTNGTDLPMPAAFHDFQSKTAEENTNTRKYKKYCLISGVALVLLVIILPTVFLLKGDTTSDESSLQEVEEDQEEIVVPNLTQYTIEALKDSDSYQSLAYKWARTNVHWESYEPWRKQQRFAMACVFYAFDGIAWKGRTLNTHGMFYKYDLNWMDPSMDECQWQIRLRSQGCDNRGRIRSLDFMDAEIIEGFLPPEVSFLSHLEVIDFSNSGLNTNLEALLPLNTTNTLPALRVVNMSDSALTGSVPSTLGLVTTLTTLELSHNALNSTIPTGLGLLSQLTSLRMSSNDLEGTIPEEIGDLPNLTSFAIDNNAKVEEFLPEGFCSGNHGLFDLFLTDWCRSIEECCPR